MRQPVDKSKGNFVRTAPIWLHRRLPLATWGRKPSEDFIRPLYSRRLQDEWRFETYSRASRILLQHRRVPLLKYVASIKFSGPQTTFEAQQLTNPKRTTITSYYEENRIGFHLKSIKQSLFLKIGSLPFWMEKSVNRRLGRTFSIMGGLKSIRSLRIHSLTTVGH